MNTVIGLAGVVATYPEAKALSLTEDQMVVVVTNVIRSPLPSSIRKEARRLLARLPADSTWVGQRLAELATQHAATAIYADPSTDLLKCVPVATVHRHMVEASWRATDVRAFVAAASASMDPAQFISRSIPAGAVVFPRPNSWLVEPADWSGLLALPARQLRRALELSDAYQPPFVLFRLTPPRMRAAGVKVRTPTALDAAAAQQPQWNPAGLSIGREYVDSVVLIEAVEQIVWRP